MKITLDLWDVKDMVPQYHEQVIAINSDNEVIIGGCREEIRPLKPGIVICEDSDGNRIEDVTHYVYILELISGIKRIKPDRFETRTQLELMALVKMGAPVFLGDGNPVYGIGYFAQDNLLSELPVRIRHTPDGIEFIIIDTIPPSS